MVITYNGLEFFKVQSGSLTLVFNPVSKESKQNIGAPRFKADIALVSLNHPDFNGTLGLGEKEGGGLFVVDGAGEYEIQDVFIRGFRSKSDYDGKERINTIYKVLIEGMSICFLGALNDKNIPDDIFGEIEGSEILFVPILAGMVF